jgi:hypothetical protein
MGELTSAKAAPYLITLSTDFSVDPLIIGEYTSSNPSSSWSDERRASAFANNIINWRGWAVTKILTVGFAENRNSREPLYFPMIIASALLNQICGDGLVITTLTHYGELVVIRAPVVIEHSLEVDHFARLSVFSPN